MNEYVMVPVPEGLVTEVMRLITDRADELVPPSADEVPGADAPPAVPWTVEDLVRLHATPNATARTIGAMLTALSECAPEPMGTSALAEATGVPRANIKGALSALTRHIRKHYGRSNWPMTFQWGPNVDPALPAEAIYHVDVETAEMWKSVTAE
jgi:hypothetical protein